jgi:phenylacetate-CoA ligase
MTRADRLKGYYDRKRETMGVSARRRYQATWVQALVAHAWRKAPGVRRRMAAAGLRPADVRTLEDLDRLPVIRKATMPDLQRADPPFGGFCRPARGPPLGFVSPGPIYEPFERRGRALAHRVSGMYAGGFRRGDIVLNTYAYHLTPAAHLIDEALALIGCTVVPTGVGNTDTQVMARTWARPATWARRPSS